MTLAKVYEENVPRPGIKLEIYYVWYVQVKFSFYIKTWYSFPCFICLFYNINHWTFLLFFHWTFLLFKVFYKMYCICQNSHYITQNRLQKNMVQDHITFTKQTSLKLRMCLSQRFCIISKQKRFVRNSGAWPARNSKGTECEKKKNQNIYTITWLSGA